MRDKNEANDGGKRHDVFLGITPDAHSDDRIGHPAMSTTVPAF
jgi:hypothetical protein